MLGYSEIVLIKSILMQIGTNESDSIDKQFQTKSDPLSRKRFDTSESVTAFGKNYTLDVYTLTSSLIFLNRK